MRQSFISGVLAGPMPGRIRRFFSGHVSRTTLLTWLLPLSFASFFGTLIIGIVMFPGPFKWQEYVLSHVISPRDNPEAYWLPALGLAVSALLNLPLVGYVEQRLRPIAPGLARLAGMALLLGLCLFLSAVLLLPAPHWLHDTLAYSTAAVLGVGVLFAGGCALKDRLLFLGGRRSLDQRLTFCWMSFLLFVIGCSTTTGVLRLCDGAHLGWAMQACEWVRHTVLWQLAFWEWMGVVVVFAFLFTSALWLPEHPGPPGSIPRRVASQRAPSFEAELN